MVALSVGFTLIGKKSDSIGMTLLFRKIVIPPEITNKDTIIEISGNISQWFDLMKEKIISNQKEKVKENVWLIANGSQTNGILGFFNCLRLESGAEKLQMYIQL